MTMQRELDNDYQGLLDVLKFKKDTKVDPESYNAALAEKMAKKAAEVKPAKPVVKPKLEEQSYE